MQDPSRVAALVPGELRLRTLRLGADAERAFLGNTGTLDPHFLRHFTGAGLLDRFGRALAERSAVRVKEWLEACEFFGRVRRRVRAPVVADIAASHGLVGALYALFERSVAEVRWIDRSVPESRAAVLAAAVEVAPWAAAKLRADDGWLAERGAALPAGAALVAVHACGALTDDVLALAIARGGPVAVLPCCRPHGRSPAPAAVARALGGDTGFDVDRTYRLERAGYTVRWDAISAAITPMNRVIAAWPTRE